MSTEFRLKLLQFIHAETKGTIYYTGGLAFGGNTEERKGKKVRRIDEGSIAARRKMNEGIQNGTHLHRRESLNPPLDSQFTNNFRHWEGPQTKDPSAI